MPGSISEPPSWKQSVHHVLGCLLSSGCCCQSCLNSLRFMITVYARNRSVTLHNSKLLANCVKGSCKEPSEQFAEESLPGGRWRTFMTSQYAIQRSRGNTCLVRGTHCPYISQIHYRCQLSHGTDVVLLPTMQSWCYMLVCYMFSKEKGKK